MTTIIETAFAAVTQVRKVLRDEDRRPCYRGNPNPMVGHCYVASEAVYHLLGGKRAGFTPCRARIGSDTHWWLVHESGVIIDPTADQFDFSVPYHVGVRAGFLTIKPSRRCMAVLARLRGLQDAQTYSHPLD